MEDIMKNERFDPEAEISFINGAPIPPSTRPVLILSGLDYDMGYQYSRQLVQVFGSWSFEMIPMLTERELDLLKIHQRYIEQETPEMVDFMNGMIAGAKDSDIQLSYEQVLTYFLPGSEEAQPPTGCSGFAAWGNATRDKKLVFGGAGDHDLIRTGKFSPELTIIFLPNTGNNFICSPPTGGSWHPGMNNKGLAYLHHGAGSWGNYWGGSPRGYGIPGGFATLHTLRFANNAVEAVNIMRSLTTSSHGAWADISGNAFVYECRDPEVIRESGYCGETDFIYVTNNALSKDLEEFQEPHPECGLSYVPHCGWIGTPQIGGSLSSVSRNAEMWNLLHNYHGKIDLEFAKMMWRFVGPQPEYPTLEEADAVYWPKQASGWDTYICDQQNAMVGIGVPDDGSEGLYYVSNGCMARFASPWEPRGHYYRVAPMYAMYELKLASTPADIIEAAKIRAQYNQYYASRELSKLYYSDVEYAPLNEVFDQAAREWISGCWYQDLAVATSGNDSICNWGRSLRAFTRCQVFAKHVYNALVPPPNNPDDLGLRPWFGEWGDWLIWKDWIIP
jgi:hypothetical protein